MGISDYSTVYEFTIYRWESETSDYENVRIHIVFYACVSNNQRKKKKKSGSNFLLVPALKRRIGHITILTGCHYQKSLTGCDHISINTKHAWANVILGLVIF